MLRRLLIIWCLLGCPFASAETESPTFIITGDQFNVVQANYYRIGNFDQRLSEAEMLRILEKHDYQETKTFSLENNRYFYFVHVIDNRSGRMQTAFLRYSLWLFDAQVWLFQDGQLIPAKKFPRFGDVFYLDVPPGVHRVIGMRLAKVKMAGRATGVKLMDFTSLAQEWAELDPVVAAIFGAIIAITFYNIAMFLVYRRIYFGFYALYSSSALYALSVLASFSHYDVREVSATIALAGLSILAFCHYSLSLLQKFPRLYRASLVVALLHVLCCGFSFVTSHWIGFSLCLPLVIGFCLLTSISSLLSGYQPARYLVLGWGMFLASCCIVLLNIAFWGNPLFSYLALFGFAFEMSLFSFAIGQKVRLSEQEALQANHHAFNQLKKVFYPHQIQRIKEGVPIEATMPTHEQDACAICFDIIGSSRIEVMLGRHFIEDSIKACVSALMVDYEESTLVAAGYRVKEFGDGFLCTVGYPFQTAAGKDPVQGAMELALRFIELFQIEAEKLQDHPPVYCSVALAFGKVQGHYPKIGVAEYDVDGRAVELALRYEAFRQRYFPASPDAHIITMHSLLFDQLPPALQEGFVKVDLHAARISVRDDPNVTHLYYRLLSHDAVRDSLQASA